MSSCWTRQSVTPLTMLGVVPRFRSRSERLDGYTNGAPWQAVSYLTSANLPDRTSKKMAVIRARPTQRLRSGLGQLSYFAPCQGSPVSVKGLSEFHETTGR